MRIVRSLFKPKTKPTNAVENKLNDLNKIEKYFDVPFIEETPKTIAKRVSSRDVNLIKQEVKKPIIKQEMRPVYKNNNTAIVKTKINAKPETTVTKAVKRAGAIKTKIFTKPTEIFTKPTTFKAEIVTKPTKEAVIEVKPEPVKLVRVRASKKTVKYQHVTTRRSSRLDSPVKTVLKVTKPKTTSSSFGTVRKSMRSAAYKTNRDILKIQSGDAAVADISFEFDDSDNSEDADEMEMIEISENDEISDVESEIEQSKPKKNNKKNKKNKNNKKKEKGSAKGKRPPITRKKDASRWERIKQVLESGGTVEALPGRIDEFDWIKRTVTGLLESSLGGCLCKLY